MAESKGAADKAAASKEGEEEVPQGDAAVEEMTASEKLAHQEGVELAEKYVEEQEARPDDDPLVLAEKARAETEEAQAKEAEEAEAAEERPAAEEKSAS